MTAGHLSEKKGFYYLVLTYADKHGKRKSKWIATKLPVKGNKKRAEALLMEARRNFVPDEEETETDEKTEGILFADFMERWLEIIKSTVAISTYSSYSTNVNKIIVPYFREQGITLQELTALDIQDFYIEQLRRVSANSVIHYHANIHRALKYAVKNNLIHSNPADKIERPKVDKFIGNFYSADEINRLFEIVAGTKLELPVLFGAFYGLRRSEVIGLKWEAINFEDNTLSIQHTVVQCNLDGKRQMISQDLTKSEASMRTLPLVPFVRERLLRFREEQKENRKLCGKCYNTDYLDYICVNEIGDLIKPSYVTEHFPELLEKYDMRRIRFHDLRHSCASLLLKNGVQMKEIQEWLGHSDFSTTANTYAHLDYSAKLLSADAMLGGLGMSRKE